MRQSLSPGESGRGFLYNSMLSARWPGMMHFLDNELNFLDNLSVALVRFGL